MRPLPALKFKLPQQRRAAPNTIQPPKYQNNDSGERESRAQDTGLTATFLDNWAARQPRRGPVKAADRDPREQVEQERRQGRRHPVQRGQEEKHNDSCEPRRVQLLRERRQPQRDSLDLLLVLSEFLYVILCLFYQ